MMLPLVTMRVLLLSRYKTFINCQHVGIECVQQQAVIFLIIAILSVLDTFCTDPLHLLAHFLYLCTSYMCILPVLTHFLSLYGYSWAERSLP